MIRVISHELNNSLAPVASLAHSGGELVKLGKHDQLEKVFATIAERAKHLEQFIQGYAKFAKLPAQCCGGPSGLSGITGLSMKMPAG